MTHLTALSVCLTASLLIGSANPIEYMVHSGYFEKNNSGLKGEASYLAIKDRETFDKAFGVAFTMGKKPNVLPVNAFDTRIVVAAIKRGGQVWEYKVEGVTADHATLTVRYGATSKDGSGAQFASPMVVSVARNGVGDKMSSSMFQDLATLLANSMWYPQTVTISWTKVPIEGNALGKFHVVSAGTRSSSPQAHPLTA